MSSFRPLAVIAVCLAVSVPALAIEDTPENRETQAQRYLQTVSPSAMMSDMTEKMSQTLQPSQREEFKSLMTKHLNLDHLTAAIKTAMVNTFTADEMQALADFYGSSVGKSAMAKMGDYMAKVMPATMQEVQAAVAKAQQEASRQQQDSGDKKN